MNICRNKKMVDNKVQYTSLHLTPLRYLQTHTTFH